MKLAPFSLLVLGACTGYVGTAPPRSSMPPPPPPPALEPVSQTTTTSSDEAPPPNPPPPPTTAPPVTSSDMPPETERAIIYPTGRWVYADGYGWMWIQNDAGTAVVDDVPYVYLYTPSYGWSWHVSPWGQGPYVYGGWVRHPWRPASAHGGWVAPSQVVVRIGDGYQGHGHHGYRPPPQRREPPRREPPRQEPPHREPPRGDGHHR